MKVDSTVSHQPGAPEKVEANREKETAQAQRAARPGTDRVDLSTEAGLLAEAIRVADQLPDVRQDLVEQARDRLSRGEVGNDLARLANSMIDRALEQG